MVAQCTQSYQVAHTANHAMMFLSVALLWGATNPFIKRGGKGIESVRADSPIKQFLAELVFLIKKWEYMVPFLINQCGSVLYYATLSAADLSLAVPITNSLTFICTGLSGKLLGEEFGNTGTFLGILFVLFGITLCVMSKII